MSDYDHEFEMGESTARAPDPSKVRRPECAGGDRRARRVRAARRDTCTRDRERRRSVRVCSLRGAGASESLARF
eukprot:4639656-Prymnesium_polylepis.3